MSDQNEADKQSSAKAAYFEMKAKLDEEQGPSSLNSKLSEKDLDAAAKALQAGTPLFQIYPRLTQEEIEKIATQVVDNILSRTTPARRKKIVKILVTIFLGMMGNAGWDIMKHYIAYIQTFFNAAEISDFMKRSNDVYEELRAKAPPDLQNFANDHPRGLKALRTKTWQDIRDELQKDEAGKTLTPLEILLLSESLESHLFCPVRC